MRRFSGSAVLLAFLPILLSGCGGSGGSGADPFALDPSAYRAQIEAIEEILYKESPPELFDCDRAARAMIDLHEKIRTTENQRIADFASRKLWVVASRADVGDAGYAAPDLAPIRKEWEDVRASLFVPADWFRSGGAEVEEAQARPVPAADPQEVFELTRVIERLERLIEDGREETEDLGEPVYSAERVGREGEIQIAGWRKWGTDWVRRLDYAAGRLPRRPPLGGEQHYVLAYQDVERALHQLRLIPIGVGIWATPFRYQWDERFTSAANLLGSARHYLGETNVRPE